MYRKTDIQPVNKWQKAETAKKKVNYTKLLDILISSLHISILEFDVKKAYCDWHTDEVSYKISCSFGKN